MKRVCPAGPVWPCRVPFVPWRYAHISWSFCASVRCDEARQVSGIDQQLALQLDRQRSVVEWPEVQCISALELQGHIVVDDSNARA